MGASEALIKSQNDKRQSISATVHPVILNQRTADGKGWLVKNNKFMNRGDFEIVIVYKTTFLVFLWIFPNIHHLHLITNPYKCKHFFWESVFLRCIFEQRTGTVFLYTPAENKNFHPMKNLLK